MITAPSWKRGIPVKSRFGAAQTLLVALPISVLLWLGLLAAIDVVH